MPYGSVWRTSVAPPACFSGMCPSDLFTLAYWAAICGVVRIGFINEVASQDLRQLSEGGTSGAYISVKC